MKKTIYTVGDLRRFVTESANEFKAKIGDGVESTEKEQNKKAYSDAKKRAKDYDGGLTKEMGGSDAKFEKEDDNMTLIDYNIAGADDKYKSKVKTQMLGYTSDLEQNNGIEKQGDYSGNKKIYDTLAKHGEEKHKAKKELNKSGLQAREWDDKDFREDKDQMYENRIKVAKFKKTKFLSEAHMKDYIPESFKKPGQKFKMKDCVDNTYLCEWAGRDVVILGHNDPNGLNEAVTRMQELMNYNPGQRRRVSTPAQRIEENKSVSNILGTLRKISAL